MLNTSLLSSLNLSGSYHSRNPRRTRDRRSCRRNHNRSYPEDPQGLRREQILPQRQS